jgi:Carboxypeptidase regulatory-like domain
MQPPAIAVSLLLFLQAPATPPQQQTQLPKATIEGIVVRVGTSEPIAGAQLTVLRVSGPLPLPTGTTPATPLGPIPPVTTDRQGKFIIKDLDPGSYRITAARNGYAKQEYGQRTAGSQGTAINVLPGQNLKDITFNLTPAGNVSGRVRDFSGEPITGLQVQLLRAAYNPLGQKTLQTAGTARTDDRGEYRMYWITPGRYYLSVGIGPPNAILNLGGTTSSNEVPTKPYPTTYYPGTIDSSKASVIDIPPGTEMSAVDVVMSQLDLFRVRGRIIDSATGRAPRNVNVSLVPRQTVGSTPVLTSLPNTAPPYNPATGTFELRDVAPGSYWVRANMSTDLNAPIPANTNARTVNDLLTSVLGSQQTTQIPLDVSNADVEGVTLVLAPGVSVAGRLRVEGQDVASLDGYDRIRIQLRPTGSLNVGAPRPQPLNADGSFTIDNITPGEYRIFANMPRPDMYIKDARLDSTDLLNQPWVVSGPVSGTLSIVLANGAGQIEGNVVNDKSEPVRGIQAVLIPDRSRDRTELFRTATTDQNGHFTMRGIQPGDYKIFAWESIEQFSYYDADVLVPFEQKGKAVSIGESSKVTAEVKLIPAAQ